MSFRLVFFSFFFFFTLTVAKKEKWNFLLYNFKFVHWESFFFFLIKNCIKRWRDQTKSIDNFQNCLDDWLRQLTWHVHIFERTKFSLWYIFLPPPFHFLLLLFFFFCYLFWILFHFFLYIYIPCYKSSSKFYENRALVIDKVFFFLRASTRFFFFTIHNNSFTFNFRYMERISFFFFFFRQ